MQCPYFTSLGQCTSIAAPEQIKAVLTAREVGPALVQFGGSAALLKKFNKFTRRCDTSSSLSQRPACTPFGCSVLLALPLVVVSCLYSLWLRYVHFIDQRLPLLSRPMLLLHAQTSVAMKKRCTYAPQEEPVVCDIVREMLKEPLGD